MAEPASDPLTAGVAPRTLRGAIEGFLLSRRAGNCTTGTVRLYEANLARFAAAVGDDLAACTPLTVQRYLTALRERMRPVTVHQHFRGLRTFFGWCEQAGLMATSPLRGVTMRAPKTLPRVPEDEHVRRLLAACPQTFEGTRTKALIALLSDSGLRVTEALRLRRDDVHVATRTLTIRAGKGQKDGIGFFGVTAGALLDQWLALRPQARGQDFLFCDRAGRPMARSTVLKVLHRLSIKTGLPHKIGPHALRHFAGTSLLRRTGDLELVRRVLRHESLAMALKYAHLTGVDVAGKFALASPLDSLHAAREPRSPYRVARPNGGMGR